ncbi:hypothetical protein A2966_03685 [Candidatus Roizmanbacteria bacterium RIFCSPLOWO2_01_FULL_41_22]|uniref:AAA+ ATPase domain-containing protein n=2 Tax=Candidatus Roizmaniibacteriota TaxID=1752723 RepID=A0A1F7JQ64_9BACT|nr:MAG: hypothetical protein A2966_03685 [Candidatus Roizmanbacteria bacterium RIFCSPLOWO2_01_FULL_41_22]OGK57734.1 MAG: hypothetical protein A3H86_03400 [Candidatus Roizmanbacteria bacterium RIFCSPLOWO2_02_FULL_41_9]
MNLSPRPFLQELTRQNIIDQNQADRYEIEILDKKIPPEEFLIKYAEIPKIIVLKTKAKLLNTDYIDITNTTIDPQALNFISQHLAKQYHVLPYFFNFKSDTLYVATADPLDLNALEFFEAKTGKRILFALTYEEDIINMIDIAYSKSITPEVKSALQNLGVLTKGQSTEGQNDYQDIGEAPITKIVNTILEFAVKNRASDVHIEPFENKSRVRYRIDGMLAEKLILPISIHESLVSRIKILSSMKIDEKRAPQDGRFTFKTDKEEVDLRVSSLPIVYGEKIVMRLLKKSGGLPSLTELGLQGAHLKDIQELIKSPYGIILVTGPTGSGKSTTLYSILSILNKINVNIVTLEDPVEYQVPGINQVQVNPQAGLTFASGLRSFLRQDPNIILVGEIRDKETTQLAIQAALTGHLVFATLHTNDAATSIPRLIDLGGEPFLIGSVLLASLAQRIVRRICANCKTWFVPPEDVQASIKEVLGNFIPSDYKKSAIRLAKGAGCQLCDHTGYLGRIGIYELLKITQSINRLILKLDTADNIQKQAISEYNFMTRKQDGYLKALQGLTTIEEALRVAE